MQRTGPSARPRSFRFSPLLWVDLNKKNMGMKLRLPQYRRIHPIYREKKKKYSISSFPLFFSLAKSYLFLFFTEKR